MYLSFNNAITGENEFQKEIDKPIYFFENSKNPININQDVLIGDFRKVNFFVGSNNSGKSRFLRGLIKIETSNFQVLRESKNYQIFYDELQESFQLFSIYSNQFGHNNITELLTEIANKNNLFLDARNGVFYNNLVENHESNSEYFEDLITLKKKLVDFQNQIKGYSDYNQYIKLAFKFIEKIEDFNEYIRYSYENKINAKVYLPVLRTIISNEKNLSLESYGNIVNDLHNIDKQKIFTGLSLYYNVLEKRNSLKNERISFEKFEKFISENFFNNKDVEIIANLKSKHINIYVDGEERNVHDIGDGVQQIILLMFPIYTSINNSWIFIEEPETHLHPGLQRIFIETLLNDKYLKSKNLRYFFTSHSNHFLDLSLQTDDISIFQFQKESQEKFIIKNVKPSKETLDLLGVNNSSVLLANSSIWVEGPTDRKYISKFLKLFIESKSTGKQHLRENIDFAFFEYGGNLISHYLFDPSFDELFSINDVRESINAFASSNKIYLLADNDNAKGRKLLRKNILEEISENHKNFKYQNTILKEIENLLPVKIIDDFMKLLIYPTEIHKLEKVKFKRNEYKSEGLGDFIKQLFETNGIKKFKNFRDESGTLKSSYKTKLCDLVINGNYTYNDLILDNKQLDNIVSSLYDFIKT